MAQIVIQTYYPCKPEVHVKASNRTTYMYLIKIRTHPKVGCWKSKGEGVLKSIVIKGKVILYQNWTFSRELFFVCFFFGGGVGFKPEYLPLEGYGYFFGTAHLFNVFSDQWISRTGKVSHTSTHCRER